MAAALPTVYPLTATMAAPHRKPMRGNKQMDMKKALTFFCKNFEEIITCLFLSFVVVATIVNVLMRSIVGHSIMWAEEGVTLAFVWCVFMGSAACYKHKMHNGIDAVVNLLPLKGQKGMEVFIDLLVLVMNVYLTWLSLTLCLNVGPKTSAVLHLPYQYIYLSLLVSFALMTWHSLRFILHDSLVFLGRIPPSPGDLGYQALEMEVLLPDEAAGVEGGEI